MRENKAHTQQRHQRWPELCIGDVKSEVSLLSCSDKLYIQLYPSSSSTAAMLLQLLDGTARLTLTYALAVATVRQVSRSAPAPVAATVQQQGGLFDAAFPCCALTQGTQKII